MSQLKKKGGWALVTRHSAVICLGGRLVLLEQQDKRLKTRKVPFYAEFMPDVAVAANPEIQEK